MEQKNGQRIRLDLYFKKVMQRLDDKGHFATSRNYRKTWNSFSAYLSGQKIFVSDLTPEVINQYNSYLLEREVTRNTISFYNRILRAVCNKAAKDGYRVYEESAFEGVFTGVDSTRKRALDRITLKKILSLNLSGETEMEMARDLFCFSFFSRGMCFVDIAFLTMNEIRTDDIYYVRSKTGQRLSVQMEPCMAEIVNKWHPQAFGDYVFPIIRTDDKKNAFKEYAYKLCRHNLMLKEIGRRVGVAFPLNSYAARHSWATLARDMEVPLSIISGSLGHTSERTTRIYLADLDHSAIDKANQQIIDAVLGCIRV